MGVEKMKEKNNLSKEILQYCIRHFQDNGALDSRTILISNRSASEIERGIKQLYDAKLITGFNMTSMNELCIIAIDSVSLEGEEYLERIEKEEESKTIGGWVKENFLALLSYPYFSFCCSN